MTVELENHLFLFSVYQLGKLISTARQCQSGYISTVIALTLCIPDGTLGIPHTCFVSRQSLSALFLAQGSCLE